MIKLYFHKTASSRRPRPTLPTEIANTREYDAHGPVMIKNEIIFYNINQYDWITLTNGSPKICSFTSLSSWARLQLIKHQELLTNFAVLSRLADERFRKRIGRLNEQLSSSKFIIHNNFTFN